jgi:hypothetical protein
VCISFEARTPRAKAFMRRNGSPKELPTGQAADFIAELVGYGFDVRSEASKDVPARAPLRPKLRLVPAPREHREENVINAMRTLQQARASRPRQSKPPCAQLGLFK